MPQSIIQKSKTFQIYDIVIHGIAMESHAKMPVVKVLKEQNHKRMKSCDSGTVINQDNPFISASPDLVIECECCGKGLVEIKCPYAIRDSLLVFHFYRSWIYTT